MLRRALRYLVTFLYSFRKHDVVYAQNEMRIGSGLAKKCSRAVKRAAGRWAAGFLLEKLCIKCSDSVAKRSDEDIAFRKLKNLKEKCLH